MKRNLRNKKNPQRVWNSSFVFIECKNCIHLFLQSVWPPLYLFRFCSRISLCWLVFTDLFLETASVLLFNYFRACFCFASQIPPRSPNCLLHSSSINGHGSVDVKTPRSHVLFRPPAVTPDELSVFCKKMYKTVQNGTSVPCTWLPASHLCVTTCQLAHFKCNSQYFTV